MPSVSVIMLVYNREGFVRQAIESIQAQTLRDYEYIIIDNGSSDSSGKICDAYAQKDDRIKVVHRHASTIGSGRNAGLALASGESIAFVDDDDFAAPDMLEFLHQNMVDSGADVSICGSSKLVNGVELPNCICNERVLYNAEQAVVELLGRKRYNAATPTKLWKRHIFDKLRFLETGKYDDITMVYKLLAEAQQVIFHGLPKYCFRRHEDNNSSFTTNDVLLAPQQLEEYFAAFHERTEYLAKKLPGIADYAQYSEWSYLISMCSKIHKNKLAACSQQLAHIVGVLLENHHAFCSSPYIQNFEKAWMNQYIYMTGGSLGE